MVTVTLRTVGALLLMAASASAASITTTFASNNSRRGNMFDLLVNNPLTVNSITVNLAGGQTMDIYVYYKSGTFVGSELVSAAWTLAGSQNVTSGGSDTPTPVDIPGFALSAGTHGLFVTTDGSRPAVFRYTDGTSSYSNADLTIFSGIGTAVPFVTAGIADRIWNGTINYTLETSEVPEPVSTAESWWR